MNVVKNCYEINKKGKIVKIKDFINKNNSVSIQVARHEYIFSYLKINGYNNYIISTITVYIFVNGKIARRYFITEDKKILSQYFVRKNNKDYLMIEYFDGKINAHYKANLIGYETISSQEFYLLKIENNL